MPTHYFEGRSCQKIHEVFYKMDKFKGVIKCPCKTKGCKADWVVLPRSQKSYNQQPAGVVYFKDKNGQIQVAGSSSDPTPAGCQRCEATTLNELRAIEKQLTQVELDKRSRFVEMEQAQMAETIAQNRRELRTAMESFSEKGRSFAREMMRRNDTRRSVYDKQVDPGVHFAILHYDDGKRR